MKKDARIMTREKLERMSRENVEYWLLHETHKNSREVDAELLHVALERLSPRTGADADEVERSLLLFHWEHDAEIAQRRQRRQSVRIVTLVVLLLTMMTAVGFALGINIWKVAYEWASEQLFMWMTPSGEVTLPPEDTPDLGYIADVWGDAVYETMMTNDVQVRLPVWKPERFSFESVDVSTLKNGTFLMTATYRSSSNTSLILSIQKTDGLETLGFLETEYEADEDLQAEFTVDGIRFFVMSNIDRSSITWIDGVQNIFITGDLSSDEATQMILTRQ